MMFPGPPRPGTKNHASQSRNHSSQGRHHISQIKISYSRNGNHTFRKKNMFHGIQTKLSDMKNFVTEVRYLENEGNRWRIDFLSWDKHHVPGSRFHASGYRNCISRNGNDISPSEKHRPGNSNHILQKNIICDGTHTWGTKKNVTAQDKQVALRHFAMDFWVSFLSLCPFKSHGPTRVHVRQDATKICFSASRSCKRLPVSGHDFRLNMLDGKLG